MFTSWDSYGSQNFHPDSDGSLYVSFKVLNKHERQYNMYMNWFIECLSKFVENSFSFPCFPCAWWNEDQRKKEMGNLNFFSYCFEI